MILERICKMNNSKNKEDKGVTKGVAIAILVVTFLVTFSFSGLIFSSLNFKNNEVIIVIFGAVFIASLISLFTMTRKNKK